MKHTLEDLIKAERALEAALVRSLTDISQCQTAGDTDGVEFITRERRDMQRAQNIVRASKARLQAFAEHHKFVPRGTIAPAAEGYPPGWPQCPACGKPAMDGHITCGHAACNEGARRHEHAN